MTISLQNRAGAERTFSVTIVAILALTIFRWVTLAESNLSLQFDEAQYWDWSRHLAFGYVSKPPLIAWVIWLTTHFMGDQEAAIRAAAPIAHAVTAIAIYVLARRLYGSLAAFWSAVAYITLPSVAYSSLVISTDALLLPFWAMAMCVWWRLTQTPLLRYALLLGICIGFGLLAKYAMSYFVLCACIHLLLSSAVRRTITLRYLVAALATVVAIIAPNLAWNFRNGWATFSHTADNADWQGERKGGILPALEFIAAQLAVFGPVLSLLGLWQTYVTWRSPIDEKKLFLLCFSLPILLIVTLQALIAGAHMNWAATAYPGLTILVVGWSIEHAPKSLLGSAALHMVVLVWICFSFAGAIPPDFTPHRVDILAKLRGWDHMANRVDAEMQEYPGYNLLVDERKYAVLYNYYLRDKPYKIVIWPFMGKTHSQFALTNSIDADSGQKVILLSRWEHPVIDRNFEHSTEIGSITFFPSPGEIRKFYLFQCEGLKVSP